MALHALCNSVDRLSWLITKANWGIAISLLLGFAFTVIAIKAGNRKDELVNADNLAQAKAVADTMKLAGDANERASANESANLHLRADLEHAVAESRSKQTELEREQRKTAE